MNSLVEKNINKIKQYLKMKNIKIDNLDDIFEKVTIDIGEKKDFPYAKVDKNNSYKIIISEDIEDIDKYKWINHELLHIVSNNLKTVDKIHVGGIIIEDIKQNIWIGQYLNEAITEYINQSIIHCKYSDYYDRYIESLEYIINIIGEEIVLKAYFENNLDLIVDSLILNTSKSKEEIISFINSIDCLYDNPDYNIKNL